MSSFHWSLRTKFVAMVFLLLLIPFVLIKFLKEVESTLVNALQQNIMISSRLISAQLESDLQWYRESQLPQSEQFVARELFVFPLTQPPVIDGFLDEWTFVSDFETVFESLNGGEAHRMSMLLGSHRESLTVSLSIVDRELVYARNNAGYRSDQLVISFVDINEIPGRLFISPSAPGELSVMKYLDESVVIDSSYIAYWAETDNGFNLELKFPDDTRPKKLRITHFDVDKARQSTHKALVSSSEIELNPLVWPGTTLTQLVSELPLSAGQRISVLDTRGRAIARKGDLKHNFEAKRGAFLFDWLLGQTAKDLPDRRGAKIRLSSPVIYDALRGKNASLVESLAHGDFVVALAATPIKDKNQVVGVVFVEENVARIQLLQRKTLVQILTATLLIIVVILVAVIVYVSRVVFRIRRLKSKIEKFTDEQGRVSAKLPAFSVDGDEIDELSNAFRQMGLRLSDYNDYLEKLAARLSHEIRTPIAIIRSSLDNLLMDCTDQDSKKTLLTALSGTERLGDIVSRMRQASSIKEAMQSAEMETVDLNQFVENLLSGFSQSFPERRFEFFGKSQPVLIEASTELIAEMLDKLLSNAIDFSPNNSTIRVSLVTEKKFLHLWVENDGPTIAKKDLKKIFQSMISIRQHSHNKNPNLGLGLYVVKLIASFHDARVKAENREDNSGVKFSVIWRR